MASGCSVAAAADKYSSNHLEVGNDYSQIASLSHTVIFHATASEMDMVNLESGNARWFCQEAWAGGSRHGRGLHQSRMWRDDGLHVASTIQDGMMRLKREDGKGAPGFSPNMIEQLSGKQKDKSKL